MRIHMCFFFSSRRRHTRWTGDWSSDVCSSDLEDSKVAGILLSGWDGYSPQVRREVLEALLARPDRVSALMDAIEANKVLPGQLESARLTQLRQYPNPKIRHRAEKLLAGQTNPQRQNVLKDYHNALTLK